MFKCLFSFFFLENIRFLDDGGSMMSCVSLSLSHTATEWLLLCPLTQTFPQKRGSKPFTPFYLLSSHLPPFCGLRGCIGAEKGSPPHVASSSPQFHTTAHIHTQTYTHRLEHWRTYKPSSPRSTAVHEVTNWGLCLLKGGGEPPLCTHTHTEPSSSIVGRFPRIPDNAHCSQRLRREIWCCLCGR